jgi:hypothetical protein
MPQVPAYITILFLATVFTVALLFMKATQWHRKTFLILFVWIVIQTILGISGFYIPKSGFPPRFALMLMPPLIVILSLMFTAKGQAFLDHIDIRWLTLIHVTRLPVEIVLYLLLQQKWIPELMSFEGRNPDILSGLSALPVFFLAFRKGKINKPLLITWNILTLALVLNIAVNGLLSAPSPFQQFGFEQPNIAVLRFPFNLLPSMIVPIVILSHLASLRQLFKTKIT